MATIRQYALFLAIPVAAACGGTHAKTAPGPARWTGSFKQLQMAASATVDPTLTGARRAGYGSITLTPVADDEKRTRIDLSISAAASPGAQLAWAIFSGPCGSPAPAVTSVNEFPAIEVNNSGGGTVHTEMSFVLEPRATYHANVYWSSRATDVSNVAMCANLQFGG